MDQSPIQNITAAQLAITCPGLAQCNSAHRLMVTGRLRQRSWETPEGDKRSVTELEADEVGASLKWATAKMERSSQRGNGDRSAGRERQAERGGDFNDAPPL